MQQKTLKITLERGGRVKMRVRWLDYWGRIRREQQITFTRAQFVRALSDADIVVTAFDFAEKATRR